MDPNTNKTDTAPIGREDYEEAACPLDMRDPKSRPAMTVPQQRISVKLDEHMEAKDFAGAERHLLYWLEEARLGGDLRGTFMIYNEMMGMYRKTGAREKALDSAEKAIALLPELGYASSASGGTCLVNAATVCAAFDLPERSLELFTRARAIYESQLSPGDDRLGGLYNNMALTLTALGRFAEAHELFAKALSVMRGAKNGELECAITWLNMADALEAELGPEAAEARINDYLERAEALLDTPTLPRDGYDAFVCEKCAPVFERYGWFLTAQRLNARAETYTGSPDRA